MWRSNIQLISDVPKNILKNENTAFATAVGPANHMEDLLKKI